MDREQEIKDYIHDKLTPKAKNEFELELPKNTNLQIQLEEMRNVYEGIKESERQELKLRLQALSIAEQASKKDKKRVIKLKPRYALLIAAGIIPIVFILNNLLSSNNSANILYSDYFTTYPNTLQPVVRGDESISDVTKAFVAYEAGDYDQASKLFARIIKTNNTPNLRFYQAMSLLNSNKKEQAFSLLTSLKNEDTIYKPQIYWYSALIELEKGNKENSIKLLDSLMLLKSGYKEKQTIELLDKIK